MKPKKRMSMKGQGKQKATGSTAKLHISGCRSCGKPLVRDKRAGHRVWYVCTNLNCEKNQRKGTPGSVITAASNKAILEALKNIRNGSLVCPTGYTWIYHLSNRCQCK
jgi:hypothetical protein